MSTSVPVSSMLILPSYTPLQSEFVDAMRNMASAPDGPATEQGEYFLMAIADHKSMGTKSKKVEYDFVLRILHIRVRTCRAE